MTKDENVDASRELNTLAKLRYPGLSADELYGTARKTHDAAGIRSRNPNCL